MALLSLGELGCCKCLQHDAYYSIIDIDGRVLTDINYISSTGFSELENQFLFCSGCSERVGLSSTEICLMKNKNYRVTSVELFSLENIRHLIAPKMSARKLIRYLSKHSTILPKPILTQYRQVANLPQLPGEYEKFLMYRYFYDCNNTNNIRWPVEMLIIIFDYSFLLES